ncbi:MAG: hypothetical protein ABF323_11235 [Lentimonas sp.]
MNQNNTYKPQESCRGSALITAVIFSFIIGALAVTFLKLASNEYRSAVRSTLYASSLNLAESGVEMGIDALASKSTSGSTWITTSTGFLTDASYQGDVKVVILNASGSSPTIYAEGVIHGHPTGAVSKQVRVELSSGFAPFEKGFSARNGITFSGNNVLLDSYNSNYGDYDTSLTALGNPPAGYGVNGKNKNDDIWVASDTLSNDDGVTVISAGNGDIYGRLAVSEGNSASVGPNGSVTAYDPNSADEIGKVRITEDFYADFPVTDHPTVAGSGSAISGTTTVSGSAGATQSNPTFMNVDSISLSGRRGILTVTGHVAMVMDGDISVTGQGSIIIAAGGSLAIYTQDDVAIAGKGVTNPNLSPLSFNVVGTAPNNVNGGVETAAQSINITGNGVLRAAVYAPTALVTLNGGGNSGIVMGGVVAYDGTLTGGSSFHFDESLRELVDGGGGGSYSIDSWLEMTGATAASTSIDMSAY